MSLMQDPERSWGVEAVSSEALPPKAAEDRARCLESPKSPSVLGDGREGMESRGTHL